MSVIEIIRKLREKDIDLSVESGSLRVRGNKLALSDSELLELVRQNKKELIETIASGEHSCLVNGSLSVPPNLIPPGCAAISPDMLPLVKLTQSHIDTIVATVSDGASNVQDIYPLAPLQEGILFHHLLENEGDVYLGSSMRRMESRECLNRYLEALQFVINRHDVFRTAVVWAGLPEPVQVVWRHAPLVVEEVTFDPAVGDIAEQLRARFDPRHYRLDVRQAPLWRLFIAEDTVNHRWLLLELAHHLVNDNASGEMIIHEMEVYLSGRAGSLSPSVPFRHFVVQSRTGVSREEHESFFTRMLGDVDEPTAPFGLMDVQRDGSKTVEAHRDVDAELGRRLRARAKASGVSAASVCHLAWAQVLARLSGREDVVFSTMMLGRMHGGEGVDRALGLFINSLPVRIKVGNEGAQASVRKTHELLSELMRHEHAPLTLAQRCSAVRAPAPLFTAMMNYRYDAGNTRNVGEVAHTSEVWAGTELLWMEERINYPLGLAVNDLGEEFSIDVQADQSIDADLICALTLTALESLVTALEQAPSTPVRSLQVLPPSERNLLLALGNGGPSIEPSSGSNHDSLYHLVEAQAKRSPDAIAVIEPGRELTYRQLVQYSNGVAQQLNKFGVGPETRVAILADRSAESLVGTLGIIASGAAYLPLDPLSPTERLAALLADASVLALLTPTALRAQADRVAAQCPALDNRVLSIAEAPACDVPPISNVNASNPAYVIYTSGTTGTSKGVVITHGSCVNLVRAFGARHNFLDQRLLMIPPLIFDASVGDVFPILAVGSTLVLHPMPNELDSVELESFCLKYRVTAIDAPAALWRRWVEGFASSPALDPILPSVRLIMFGGESVSLDHVRRFAQLTEKRIALSNHYGPTETTVCATLLTTCDGAELSGTDLPIGRPLPGVQAYVLDQDLQLLPRGVEGELYIGGVGVAREYLGEPELTAKRFLRDPFSKDKEARIYATGDIVRWNSDGTLQFLGRRDQQVKIRGFRIELGEIEARLGAHEGVGEAVVVAREDEPGDKRLVAYVTAAARPDGRKAELELEGLRTHLSASLPEYMVPAAYVVLERLPLTPNGKLDRKALPAPEGDAYGTRGYVAPVGEVENRLARIWAEVLKLERVGRYDNFFELGGHSLLAVTLLSRLRQVLGIDVSLKDLFAHAQLAGFAEALKGAGRSEQMPLTAVSREEELPLSYAQQRLWFLGQMEGGSEAYHVPQGLRLKGRLERGALKKALERIVWRHEGLRTSFARVGERTVQRIAAPGSGFALQEEDLRGEAEAELTRWMGEEAGRPFDLEHGPLLRGLLLRLAEEEHVLLITMHHIVSDGWSMGVLTKELSALYRAYRRGGEDPLPPLAIQYADYAVWQRRWLSGEVLERQSGYWRERLAGAPALLELPLDRPRPARQSFSGERVGVELNGDLTRRLKALSQRHGMTLYMTVLAGWAAVLARLSGQAEVVIGTPIANRTRAELEGLIGYFVNTQALRVAVTGTVAELLEQVKGHALGAQDHQDLPFEQVVELVKAPRSLSYTPVFQAMLAWQNTDDGRLDLPGLTVSPADVEYGVAKFDLELELGESGSGIAGELSYATGLFERSTIERHVGYLRRVLEAMVADERQAVERIDLLSEAERQQLLIGWNATQAEYPADQCVHELFEAQVARTPEAVAVVYENQTLSYRELNGQANRLAHHLVSLGVKPDDRVAICVERGLEMVVGILAILKAGGAYVPLDPVYPAERLAYMLGDSTPVAVLTTAEGRAALAEQAVPAPWIDLQTDVEQWRQCSPDNLDVHVLGLEPRHLAYIIYTSGSTGAPKGVMIEHANVGRLFAATEEWFHFNSKDVWTLFHSFAFDFSVWEIWGALLYGGRLVVVPFSTSRSPEDFYRLLCEQKVTILNQTPSAFGQLIAAQALSQQPHTLRHVIFGGEALEMRSLAPWYERNSGDQTQLVNMYGITETTVHVTYQPLRASDVERYLGRSPIGSRIPDLRIYILDGQGEPVAVGVAGELYIGGAGVARGYLNRGELTAERFVADPFAGKAGARMYKTGDLGRWQGDGGIEYLGRNDQQVKIRGFRVELGEIEACLGAHEGVGEAVVVAREDEPGDKRLVAYVTAAARPDGRRAELELEGLRTHLAASLPEYMVPAAYVVLERLPLTPNGKLDRKALPAPEGDAYGTRGYVAPVGEVENRLAGIWAEVLKLERVGRHDNFFELGGHSLLAVTLIESMRRADLPVDVRALFASPTLMGLATSVGADSRTTITVPPNRIPPNCNAITPAMLPLVSLSQNHIDRIVASVPGGVSNVQDIYPLAPLQEGFLFHHLLEKKGDVYLTTYLLSTDSRDRFDRYAKALQLVIDRHDILRTAIFWEGLPDPVQVVWRYAPLAVEEVTFDPAAGDIAEQMSARFDPRHYRLDVRQAPLLRLFIAEDLPNYRWIVLQLMHHLVDDRTTMEFLQQEVQTVLRGESDRLPATLPFRNFVAQTRSSASRAEDEAFFSQMLGDVDEPTTPFDLMNVQGDGSKIVEAYRDLDAELFQRLRARTRALGVSSASLCHLAWALVLARICGRNDVVFGTVMFGRMHGGDGADRMMGTFINTLPVRIRVGDEGAQATVRATHALLSELLRHEHAPLVLTQRCSAVRSPAPLFSSLLNYRYADRKEDPRVLGEVNSRHEEDNFTQDWAGMEFLGGQERVNYPLSLSINDLGSGLSFDAQVDSSIDPERVCALLHNALEAVVTALEHAPMTPVRCLDVLPPEERNQLLIGWNETRTQYPQDKCVHELFEAQAARTPDALATVYETQTLTYRELNRRANQLAHHLVNLGVKPDDRVAICMERSLDLVIGLLGILKAGGAYVPLDPTYPAERLEYMLKDVAPRALLTQERYQGLFIGREETLPIITAASVPVSESWPETNINPADIGLTSRHLAYIVYTSGSTGLPKGVMIEHRSILRLVSEHNGYASFDPDTRMAFASNPAFDATTLEVWAPLLNGGCIVVIDQLELLVPERFKDALVRHRVNILWLTVGLFNQYAAVLAREFGRLHYLIVGGDALDPVKIAKLLAENPPRHLINGYGPTETTTFAATHEITESPLKLRSIPIGRPIANTRIYILDQHGDPAPLEVPGELFIGGDGLARGYLNRPELTAERFVEDPFAGEAGARMYRTGDLGRWLADGTIEFLGRNDFQVKIRGFRIELGEIEARLNEHPGIRDAVVLAREDHPGEKRLVAYVTATVLPDGSAAALDIEALRVHLLARLPEYMVPAAYVTLGTLPLNPNGKLDRRALPAPEVDAYVTRGYEEPAGEVESRLARIWAEVLKIERVGRHDNFFELGGHSLLALHAVNDMRQEFGAEVALGDLFGHPVLADLAHRVSFYPRSLTTIAESPRTRPQSLFVNGQSLRFSCIGEGPGPVIILESAFGMPLEYWQETQTSVARFARVCSYDRAEKTVDVVEDLHSLLAHADLQPPYILVGHSLGGICARMFTRRFPSEVAGLVLVDSSHEEQLWRQREITKRPSLPWADFSGFLSHGQLLKWHYDVPLIVIQRGLPEHIPGSTKAQSGSHETLWHSLQTDLARRSMYGKLITAKGSGHMIPLRDPLIVAASIREVFDQVATGMRRSSGSELRNHERISK